jgi:PAS domain S-box-containing protein
MIVRYAVAVFAVLAALGLRMAVDPVLGSNAPYLVFVLAVMVAARFGGRRAGWLATVLSTLAVTWFFLPPRGTLIIDNGPSATGLGLFVLVAFAVSFLAPGEAAGVSALTAQVDTGNIAARPVSRFSARRLQARPHVWWFGAAILLLVIEAALIVSIWTRFTEREYMASHTTQVLRTIDSLFSGLKDAESGARGYVLTGNDAYLEPYRSEIGRMPDRLEELRLLTSDNPIQQERISQLGPVIRNRLTLLAATIELRSNKGLDATLETFTTGAGRQVMENVRSLIDQMRAEEESLLAQRRERAAAAATGMQVVMLSGGGLLLLVLLGGSRSIGVNTKNRERAEDALRESEDQFRTLANAMPQLSWMAHADGSIFWYNDRWYQYTGATPDEMKGWGWQSVHDPEALPGVMEQWNVSLTSGAPFDMIFPLRGADGTFRPFLTRGVPVRDHDGKIVRWFGTNTDISEQQRIEEALRASETRLRALSDNLPEGMVFRFRLDADNKPYFEFVSAGIERLTGFPAAEFMARGESFDSFIIPEDRDRLRAAIVASRERLTHFEIEVRHQHRARGRIGWSLLRWIATRNPDGSLTWDGVELDITNRKQAQQALVISEQRFRKLFENAAVAIAIMDLDGRLLRSNAAYLNLHGYAGDELSNKHFGDLMTPEDLQVNLAEMRRLKAGEIPFFRNETQYIRGDGGRVWVEKFVSLLPGERGDASEVIALVTDVTERKRAEAQVKQLNAELENRVRRRTAQLEAANKELEAFAYSVSHDLRAPLRGIDGWSLALMEDYGGRLDATAHKYLERVRSETQRMGLLIDDLLQLSRVTRSEMNTAVVDLSSTAAAIAARLRHLAPGRQIEFVIENGVKAAGDGRLLEIALENLLSNAVKFTGPVEHARVEFGSTTSGGDHVYYVRDNGVGFDMAYSKTLFGAFQRLHKAAEFPGTGVGLATVQRIIHRHGGRVWAESAPNKGASFYFTIGG